MNEVIHWLLGLDQIRLDDSAPISFRFGTPPAPWIMLFGALITSVVVAMSYRRYELPGLLRWLLGLLRFGIIMSVLFVCGQPLLVLSRVRTEPSFVGILIDESASMSNSDRLKSQTGFANGVNRWSAAVEALASDGGLMKRLVQRHQLGLWGFGRSAAALGLGIEEPGMSKVAEILGDISPEQDQTDIPRAVRQVLHESQGRRGAGLILISDGSQTELDDLEPIISLARSRSLPIHVLAVGSPEPRRDLAITSLWAPEEVFLRDTVSVHYEGTARAVTQPVELMIELRDEGDGELLVSQTQLLPAGEAEFAGELQFAPGVKGRRGLVVRVVPLPDEEIIENNEARTGINAHDEKIGVLYVEKQPRFEYRYLKNLILREQNIESSCLLLDASPGFPPEGSRPIRRFPDSIEKLGHYDVIILGDVDLRANWIAPAQLTMLADYVSVQGAGIAFLAGEHFMPAALERTPLEKILPVVIERGRSSTSSSTLTADYLPELTTDGRANPIFRLEREAEANEQTFRGMPGFYWFAKVARAQFGATVLAVHPTASTQAGPLPLAVLGRYGAGRTFFLGTDELWRWRQYSGDSYYESIWLQIIHTLARGRKLGTATPWQLQTDRRRYELGQEVRISLACTESGPSAQGADLEVWVKDAHGAPEARVQLRPVEGSDREWEGRFVPTSAGSLFLTMSVPGHTYQPSVLSRSIVVERLNPEMSRREANHEYLQRIAAGTGGVFRRLSDGYLDLAEIIPDRSVQIADDIEEPIWDSRLMFALLMIMLTSEWAIRRWKGVA